MYLYSNSQDLQPQADSEWLLMFLLLVNYKEISLKLSDSYNIIPLYVYSWCGLCYSHRIRTIIRTLYLMVWMSLFTNGTILNTVSTYIKTHLIDSSFECLYNFLLKSVKKSFLYIYAFL